MRKRSRSYRLNRVWRTVARLERRVANGLEMTADQRQWMVLGCRIRNAPHGTALDNAYRCAWYSKV